MPAALRRAAAATVRRRRAGRPGWPGRRRGSGRRGRAARGRDPQKQPATEEEAPAKPKRRPRRRRPISAAAEPARGQAPDEAGPSAKQLTAYDPRSEPEKTFGILAAGFTLLALAVGGGGIARGGGVSKASSGGGGPGGGSSRPGFSGLSSYQGVEIRHLAAGFGAVALGDRSRTWKWPATQRVDYLAAAIPVAVARRSPLLGRVLADSAYLRAILGSASLMFPLAGLALGIAAVSSTGGEALPPSTALVIAIVVIGVLDASAGFVALTTFLLGVLALGGLTTADDVRFMLGLGALWAVVPVLAGVTRPLRRPPTSGIVGLWDRGADFLVVSLIGAWTVQRIVLALPGLAGVELEIAEHADEIALFVLGGLVVRVALETLAAHFYPLRLDSTAAPAFPDPTKLTLIGSALGRTAIYAFLLYVLVGDVLAALGLVRAVPAHPAHLGVSGEGSELADALSPHPEGHHAVHGVPLRLHARVAAHERGLDPESESFFPNVMVGFGLVGLLLPLPLMFGRSGEARKIGWGKRLLGLAVVVIAILQVRGYLIT